MKLRFALVCSTCVVPLCLLLIGCGSGGPTPPFKTHPVTGKVVFKGGRQDKLERGKVWFQSTADKDVQAVGQITDDGTFTMSALQKDKAWAGVPAGDYKVKIDPPLDDQRNKQWGLIHLKYLDFDKSGIRVTVPVKGELVIEVARPGRG